MAISDIAEYTHLSPDDVAAIERELDAIRRRIDESLGARDAAYIRHTIVFQRTLDTIARLVIACSRTRFGWCLGTGALAFAKIVENMEIGHNVSHGQWDWMNDPEIHSTTWEWDMVAPSAHWKHGHNYRHHMYTNVLDMDDDIGFGVMRVSRDQAWRPAHLLQPLQNLVLAFTFEWGIAVHGLERRRTRDRPVAERRATLRTMLRKTRRQVLKDYVVLPALSGRRWRRTLAGGVTANVLRNLWTYVVIFCGHFPDGADKFTAETLKDETKGEWYLRQMLGSANFDAGPLLAFSTGNLCYQIEHHLFPDLPSNRLAEIAPEVRALCKRYGLPYTTGPLARQYLSAMYVVHRLALPNDLPGRRREPALSTG